MTRQVTANPAPGFAKHPDHRITVTPATGRVRVLFRGETVAESGHALVLQEASYPPVHYFPRGNVRMDLFTRTDHHSTCPFKGEASYWSLPGAENIAWSYETPYDETAAIKDHIAFYEDKVTVTADG